MVAGSWGQGGSGLMLVFACLFLPRSFISFLVGRTPSVPCRRLVSGSGPATQEGRLGWLACMHECWSFSLCLSATANPPLDMAKSDRAARWESWRMQCEHWQATLFHSLSRRKNIAPGLTVLSCLLLQREQWRQ